MSRIPYRRVPHWCNEKSLCVNGSYTGEVVLCSGLVNDCRAHTSQRYIEPLCEVGATERGCSGSIGSDDTRGYGAGSGDVGKELPGGMIP